MADPFVAEIRIFPFNFPPKGWAWCDGQLLPISQNTALFSLLGTYYGGDGKSTFALPNLQGSAPLHHGQGPGLSERFIGEQDGSETVNLLESEIPAHRHNARVANQEGDIQQPGPTVALARPSGATPFVPGNTNPALVLMEFQSLAPQGASFPHNNMQPYLTMYFNIALQGVFPPRG